MERPEVPQWWRGALVALALLQVPIILAPVVPQFGPLNIFAAWSVGNAAIGTALAIAMVRRGARDRIAALAGMGIAIVFAFASESPFFVFAWIGPGVAVALVCARPHVVATALASLGLVGTFASVRLAFAYRGPIDSIPPWTSWLAFASGAALVLGLLVHAAASRAVAALPLTPRARLGLAIAGTVALALSWLIGGSLLFLPLWPLALALLVAPAVLAWRAWPAGSVAVALVALAGAIPAGTCTYDPWSDAIVPGQAPDADARPELVTLAEAGTHGPRWGGGGGFSGYAVRCPPLVDTLGLVWDAALVAAVFAVALRARRLG